MRFSLYTNLNAVSQFQNQVAQARRAAVENLSYAYFFEVKKVLSLNQMRQIRLKNLDIGNEYCASLDHLDANETMTKAFYACFHRFPDITTDEESSEDTSICADALMFTKNILLTGAEV